MRRHILPALGAATLAGSLLPFLELLRHRDASLRLSTLYAGMAGGDRALPRLSVIVPARNEEASLEAAVSSLLAQEYPGLEVVLVDDRSTDRTGEIMLRVAEEHPDKVRLVTIESLPPGWLGKNHALWVGSQRATGEWLLFTDADVVFEPGCLRITVEYAEAEALDHLTLGPRLEAQGYWLNAFIAFFVYAFLSYQRPYLANDPNSEVGAGFGVFNLVRRSAYEAVGAHAAISLRPDDDMRLGLRIKRKGFRQRVLDGSDLLGVEWYPSLGAAIRGLEKNTFAGLDYDLPKVLGAMAALWLANVFPYVAVWKARGTARRLLLATIATQAANFTYANRRAPRPPIIYLPAFPAVAVLFSYTVLRSTWKAIAQGGIRWRDTFYPLEELRSQTGLEGLPPRHHL